MWFALNFNYNAFVYSTSTFRKPVHVRLKNTLESKYSTPQKKKTLFYLICLCFKDWEGRERVMLVSRCVVILKRKGTFNKCFWFVLVQVKRTRKKLFTPTLKHLIKKMCVPWQYINNFEKALMQIQERVKKDWSMYKRFLLHKKAFLNYSQHKRLSNEETAVLIENDYLL